MRLINIFCFSALILSGIVYGINCIVTKKASWRSGYYEGKDAVAAGWAIVFMFVCVALGFIYILLYLE